MQMQHARTEKKSTFVTAANNRDCFVKVHYMGRYEVICEIIAAGENIMANITRGMYRQYEEGQTIYVWTNHLLTN